MPGSVVVFGAGEGAEEGGGRGPVDGRRAAGDREAVPRCRRQRRRRPRGPAGRDPRPRRRERRRQVDPDEDPVRHAVPRRGHHARRRRARGVPLAQGRHRRPASAWCTSTSCWPTSSPCWRTWCSAASRRPRGSSTSSTAKERIGELAEAYGLDVDADEMVETPRGRRAPAGRDHQGALPGRPHPHPRRADRRPRAGQEIEELFVNLRELKAQGETIVFISHKLDEVLAIADAITVLRAGRTVATVEAERGHRGPAGRADGGQRAPDAGDPRVHRDRPGRAGAGRRVRRRASATAGCSSTSTSGSTGVRWSASPGSRATASRS